jgi:hypothetical protein
VYLDFVHIFLSQNSYFVPPETFIENHIGNLTRSSSNVWLFGPLFFTDPTYRRLNDKIKVTYSQLLFQNRLFPALLLRDISKSIFSHLIPF